MNALRLHTAALILIGIVACACSRTGVEDDTTGAATDPLIKWASTPLFGPDSGTITVPYCFVTTSPSTSCNWKPGTPPAVITAAEQSVWVNAIETAWGSTAKGRGVSRVQLKYTGTCDLVSDSTKKVVVWIMGQETPDSSPPYQYGGSTFRQGANALITVNAVTCPENATAIFFSNGEMIDGAGNSVVDRIQYVGVHEFGHILGFEHEQDQDGGFSDPNLAPYDTSQCYPAGKLNDAGVFVPGPFPDDDITEYDPDSVMNYCRTTKRVPTNGGGGDGRLSDLDIVGVQRAYGAGVGTDSDNDKVPDYADNCPYAVNGAQLDSNFEAEQTLALSQGWSGTTQGPEGHQPNAYDAANFPTYVLHYQTAYQGDACDAITTAHASTPYASTNSAVRTAGCWDYAWSAGKWTKTYNATESCPIRYYSELAWDSQTGGPAGLAGVFSGTNASTFCYCPYANDTNNASKCQSSLYSYHCVYGDDTKFPPVDGSNQTMAFKAIHHESAGSEAWLGQFSQSVIDPVSYFNPNTHNDMWATVPDLGAFSLPTFPPTMPASDDLVGVLWTQTQSYPYTVVNVHVDVPLTGHTGNLQDSYTNVDVGFDYGVGTFTGLTGPYSYRWQRVPYCDPTPFPNSYGMIAHFTAPPMGGSALAFGTRPDGTIDDISRYFTPIATAKLAGVWGGLYDLLDADDSISGQPRNETGYGGLLVDTGTTKIRGAFTHGIGQINFTATSAVLAAQSSTTLRTYSAREMQLYSLEFTAGTGTWSVVSRDVAAAMGGTASSATHALTGGTVTTPVMIAYNRANRLVYALDLPLQSTGHYKSRLVTIDPTSGALTELWKSGVFASTAAPYASLSTTTDGDLFIGFSGITGDTRYHIIHLDISGRPWHSYVGTGTLHNAVVGHGGGFTIPLNQTVDSTHFNASFTKVGWASTTTGACADAWIHTYFYRTASGITGSLADGMVCP